MFRIVNKGALKRLQSNSSAPASTAVPGSSCVAPQAACMSTHAKGTPLFSCGLSKGVSNTTNRNQTTTSSSSRRHMASTSASTSASAKGTEDFFHYGKKKQTAVSLKALMETGIGKRLDGAQNNGDGNHSDNDTPFKGATDKVKIQIACFLHRELPIRLAHRAADLANTAQFKGNRHVENVISWYRTSFKALRACAAPTDIAKEEVFAKTLEDMYDRHSHTLITMAMAAHELRQSMGSSIDEFAAESAIQKSLDEFYHSRIGIRILIGQYLEIRKPKAEDDDPMMIGLISQKCNVKEIALRAAADARYMCDRVHGDSPEIHIFGRTDLTFPYLPTHIEYMLLELLKNSVRATVEAHGIDNMPRIKIIIADSEDNEECVIKISDEGGGIPRSNMNKIWSFLFTTADPAILESLLDEHRGPDFSLSSPLAGLGYGIPIARNFCRYFGGDLTIMSMEGYGTDSYIYLPKLREAQLERRDYLVK